MALQYQPGLYKMDIEDQAWNRAKNGTTRMLVLVGKVVAEVTERGNGKGGTIQEAIPVANSYARTIRVVVLDTTAQMAMKKLRHAGFTGDKWSQIDLKGKTVFATCTHQNDGDGRPKENWDLALPGRDPLVSEDDIAKELDIEFPNVFTVVAAAQGSREAKPASVPDDDDLPFGFFAIFPLVASLLHGILS